MINDVCATDLHILVVILDCGKGSKVLRLSRQAGISGGTICIGEGTVGHKLKSWLEVPTVRREIVFMVASGEQIGRAHV